MKSPDDVMRLEDLEGLLAAASEASNHRRFVIAGSLSALGAVVRPPRDMVMSRDLDFYPQLDPGRGFIEIASELGENSPFHQKNGFYADPISPKLLALPDGWESRLAPYSMPHGVVAFFMEPNDVAVGKLARGEDHDLRWIRAGLGCGALNADVIRQRIRTASTLSADECSRARLLLDEADQADDGSQDPDGTAIRPERTG